MAKVQNWTTAHIFEHHLHLPKIGDTFLDGVSLSDLIWTYVVTGAYCLVQGRVWRFHQRQQITSWPIELDFQFESWGRKPHADHFDPLSGVINLSTPLFWQLKIPSSNNIHSVDALVLYGNTIYSVRGILFNGIKPRQNHTAADVFLNYLRYFTLIKSSPISDMRPIGEGLIKRKVFAGAHTI